MRKARTGGVHWWSVLLMVGGLVFLYQDALLTHIRLASSVLNFQNDARSQITPFYRYSDPALFPNDYLGDYFLRRTPVGVRSLYMAAAPVWDAERVSKYLPYVLLVVVLLAVGLATCRLGGHMAAFFAVALGLSSGLYLHRMTGGLARSFGFPLISLAALALVHGRLGVLAALVVLGSTLYPSMAVPTGLAFATVLFLLPAGDRGRAAWWSLTRRLVMVGLTAATAACVMLPSQLSLHRYGRMLRAADIASYPEAGPGGRYWFDDRPPFLTFTEALPLRFRMALVGQGTPVFPPLHRWAQQGGRAGRSQRQAVLIAAFAAVTVLGGAVLFVENAAARRLLTLLPAITIAHYAARFVYPYLYIPRRYLEYPVPVLTAILLPAAAAALPHLLPRRLRHPLASTLSVVLICGFWLLALGGRGSGSVGLNETVAPTTRMYSFLATLPPDALIAGWPRGVIDDMPYLSRRQALLTFETHDAFFEGYAKEMRRRMYAFLAAYYATDLAPLLELRDHFGVTHLIVNRNHYGQKPPHYFQPFTDAIKHAWQRAAGKCATLRQDDAQVFAEGSLLVLDLQRLHVEPAAGSD